MIEEVCAEIRNWFTYRSDIYIGDYKITDNVISPSIDFKGSEYIRIIGSRKNNGVHHINDQGEFELENESTFHGSVWLMCPPKEFLLMVKDIEHWQAKYGNADSINMNPYQSESFGGYSYTKSSGSSADGSSGSTPSWKDAFASRLKQYRRIRDI